MKAEKTVATYFACTRAADLDNIVKLFTPDAVFASPVTDPPGIAHEGIQKFFASVTEHFDSIGVSEEFVFVDEAGNEAAVKWQCIGMAKNGRGLKFDGIDIIRFTDDGRIRELRGYWDSSVMLQALES